MTTRVPISDAAAAPPVLTYDGCVDCLTWTGAIGALRQGHGLARPHLGDLLLGPASATLLNRAAHVAGLGYVVKAETVFTDNAGRGLPSIQGRVLLFDAATGAIRAVIESRLVTEYKTAADSVLAAQILASPGSRHLLIVGAGVVAASLVQAYGAAFPGLERISVWARRPEQAQAMVESLGAGKRGAELAVATDLRRAAEGADIVSAATMARDPILFGDWIAPGTHVDLIGGFTPAMREADDALIAKARLFVDYRGTTVEQVGDITQPIAAGVIDRAHVLGDLYDLVDPAFAGVRSDDAVTVFKNGGGAHLDLMIADYVARAAGGVAGGDRTT